MCIVGLSGDDGDADENYKWNDLMNSIAETNTRTQPIDTQQICEQLLYGTRDK